MQIFTSFLLPISLGLLSERNCGTQEGGRVGDFRTKDALYCYAQSDRLEPQSEII